MRRLFIFMSVFIPLSGCSKDEARFSDMLIMVRSIEIGLHEQYLVNGKPLPSSLNEIDFLKEIAARSPAEGMLFNEMAVVTGAPKIIEETGIRRDHINWRLFAIGREVNTDKVSFKGADGNPMPGRYSVWISPDGTYCSPGWIPETEVQAALKQIGGFDPTTQPLAFPDAAERVRENIERKRKLREGIREDLERAGRRSPKERSTDGSAPAAGNSGRLRWLLIGIVTLALLLWLTVFVAGRRGKG